MFAIAGNFYIDENVLRDEGITDLTPYAYSKGDDFYDIIIYN